MKVNLHDTATYTLENTWIFLGFKNHKTGSEECVPGNIIGMSITFDQINCFCLTSSCNTGGGCYSVSEPDSIHIDGLMMTCVGCINDTVTNWEERYISALYDATKYNILGNRLRLKRELNLI